MVRDKSEEINTIHIWGIKLNPISLDEFIKITRLRIEQKLFPIHFTGVNPETVVHAFNNDFLKKAILDSDFVNIDNNFVVLTLRFLGYHVPGRVATPDLFEALLKLANKENYRIFIIGAKQEILEKAIENIRSSYPNIIINGMHGYFPQESEVRIIENIKEFTPDMLFIALPSPYKESFILKYKNDINAKVYLGVGGAIDVKGEQIKRAPLFLRKIGLEGIFRSFQSPLNYGKRYLTYYPTFLKIVINSKNGIRK